MTSARILLFWGNVLQQDRVGRLFWVIRVLFLSKTWRLACIQSFMRNSFSRRVPVMRACLKYLMVQCYIFFKILLHRFVTMLYSCWSYNYLNEDIALRYDFHTKYSKHRLKRIFLAEANIENCTVESKIKSPQNSQKSSVISCSTPSVSKDRKPGVLEDIKKEQETTNPSYDLVVPTCLSSITVSEHA